MRDFDRLLIPLVQKKNPRGEVTILLDPGSAVSAAWRFMSCHGSLCRDPSNSGDLVSVKGDVGGKWRFPGAAGENPMTRAL